MVKEPLVSVIMPAYNCADYIEKSIRSVLSQTYSNLEIVITDDCSTDNTVGIITRLINEDNRIRLYRNNSNMGAAVARNTSIKEAKGEYLAFLDSDDIWLPEKLKTQISSMEDNSYTFTCTTYGKIDAQDHILDVIVTCDTLYDYNKLLRKCPGNSTIIYNCKKVGKIYGPDIRRRNDFAMWLQVIKKTEICHGINKLLGYHRIREGSISIDKKKLLKYQWMVYRDVEGIGYIKSIYLLIEKILKGIIHKNG